MIAKTNVGQGITEGHTSASIVGRSTKRKNMIARTIAQERHGSVRRAASGGDTEKDPPQNCLSLNG